MHAYTCSANGNTQYINVHRIHNKLAVFIYTMRPLYLYFFLKLALVLFFTIRHKNNIQNTNGNKDVERVVIQVCELYMFVSFRAHTESHDTSHITQKRSNEISFKSSIYTLHFISFACA